MKNKLAKKIILGGCIALMAVVPAMAAPHNAPGHGPDHKPGIHQPMPPKHGHKVSHHKPAPPMHHHGHHDGPRR